MKIAAVTWKNLSLPTLQEISRIMVRHVITMTVIEMKAYTYIEKGRFELLSNAHRHECIFAI